MSMARINAEVISLQLCPTSYYSVSFLLGKLRRAVTGWAGVPQASHAET